MEVWLIVPMKQQLVQQSIQWVELRDRFAGTISGCVNKGAVSSTKYDIGGICGFAYTNPVVELETIIENSYNTGAITANNGGYQVGRYLW